MMKMSILFFLGIIFLNSLSAQSGEIDRYIKEGVIYHDHGDYENAIKQYEKALAIDKEHAMANYEIAYTYFAMKEYEKSIAHCDRVLDSDSEYKAPTCIIKGSCLDLLGKPEEAIETYEEGIDEAPDNFMLYYNLALTQSNLGRNEDAVPTLQKALVYGPMHSSSHLMMANIMSNSGQRIKSLLAYYNYLLLEPSGARARTAYELFEGELAKGITKGKDKNTINIFTRAQKGDDDGFGGVDVMFSLLSVASDLDSNKQKTESEILQEKTKALFVALAGIRKDKEGFWWEYYVDFFDDLEKASHLETFIYFISQSKEDETVNVWLRKNKEKVTEMLEWVKNYERKYE